MARPLTVCAIALLGHAFAANSLRVPPTALLVSFNASTPLKSLTPTYLGFNLDTASLYYNFDLRDQKLIALVRALGPSVLRCGGTAADFTFFIPNSTTLNDGLGNLTMNAQQWSNLVRFAQATGHHLLFDLNLAQRTANGSWDSSANASALWAYTAANFPGVDISWSVGNEPNLWKKPLGPGTLARDALILKEALRPYNIGSMTYGPSYAEFPDAAAYITATKGNITGVTFHHYPYKHDCSVHAFLNLDPVWSMGRSLKGVYSLKEKHGSPDLKLVLEEIGGAYGGGCPNITNVFVSGMW